MPGKLKDEVDNGSDATSRDVDKVKARVAEAKAKPQRDDEDVEIDVSDNRDDDDDDADDDDGRPSRAERRRERGQNFVREANERAERAERAAEQTRRELAELRGQFSARQAPAEAQKDEHDVELERAYSDQEALHARYELALKKPGGITADELKEFRRLGQEIEQRKYGAIAKKVAGGKPQDPDAVVREVRRRQVVEEHSDVFGNKNALTYADGVFKMMLAEGKPDTQATMAEAMDRARVRFGMRPRNTPPASDSAKRRLSGMSRGAGSGGAESSRTVTMTKEYRRMADAAYAHVKDPKIRYKMWAKGPGKRLMEKAEAS